MWSESKRKYFAALGYSESRIKSLEAAESATKAAPALTYKTPTRPNPIIAAMRSRTKAAPTRPNPITPLIEQQLAEHRKQTALLEEQAKTVAAPPHAPIIARLMARSAALQ